MRKLNNNSLIIVVIIILSIIGKYFTANRYDILLNYNEKDYKTTQFVVNVKGKKSLSGYYLVDKEYYKENKSKSKQWIEEDIKVKNLGNKYCEPRIGLLKSIKNLDEVTEVKKNAEPDMSMIFIMQKEKTFSNESYNYYDGKISIYLEQNIIVIDDFGRQSSGYYVPKKEKYYTIDNKVKENIDKVIEQVLNESK